MKKKLDPSREAWMRAAETSAVMDALTSGGGAARFVGGAVRNALLQREVGDVDIATPLLPQEVMSRLESARIRAVPTGIEHGTITATVNGRPFEVTTLRRDVETDGRHAVVAYSEKWEEDAQRRDFTINALYASADGELFDFHGGLDDLDLGHVRFIGDPVARIREDYLRILRLFRFHAWYGKGEIDKGALHAATAERTGLRRLSGERIQKELLRLLGAERPCPCLHVMNVAGILAEVIPEAVSLDRLDALVAIDAACFFPADPVLRLAALTPAVPAVAESVADRLKLSNEHRDRIVDLAGAPENLSPAMPVCELRSLLYRLGTGRIRDRIFLRWSEDKDPSHAIAWRALLALAEAWVRPRFPLTGRDVMAAGVPEGPLVGKVLSDVEEWWIANNFTDDGPSLGERLKTVVQGVVN
ncbi:MAG TPA: CCA tRNA nucleotidyltransferase [Rhizomicrobium sp.]|jgi:poly(A) polymerase|nr:CCA tRNA nucleotidyltransferase [Rhizomicrobium sp.]